MPGLRHGHTSSGARTPTYRSWRSMIWRCKHDGKKSYKLKGIRVCDRWLVFENFLADMGERPPGTSLDRHPDKRGNYEPGNVRWATPQQQAQNRINNRMITIGGEVRCATDWSNRLGISLTTLRRRYATS